MIEEEGPVIEGHMHALYEGEAVIQSGVNLRLNSCFVVVIAETTVERKGGELGQGRPIGYEVMNSHLPSLLG